jgi:ABC-2 type transport system permease protein
VRAALIIARKDLKQRLRDRSAIVAAFVAPLAIAFIVSGAFGQGFTGEFGATYAVVDLDGSDFSRAFTEQVLRSPQLRNQIHVIEAKTPDEARASIRRDEVGAAFVFPQGFAADVIGNRKASVTVLGNPDSQIGTAVAEAIAKAYTEQINATRLSVGTAIATMNDVGSRSELPFTIPDLVREASGERIPVRLVDGRIGVREITGANYFGPAMAVFSLFFTTAFVARSLIGEREEGTLPRILAAPIPRPAVVLGKSLSAFVIGLASFAVMFGVFGALLDVEWGDPLAIIVLTVLTVIAVMGLMTVTQTLAKTQEGSNAVAQMMAITLALFGGSFFPIFQMPEVMQKLSYATPNGWALRGFTDIAYDGATLSDLGPHLLAIGAFAVVTTSIGLWRSRRIA